MGRSMAALDLTMERELVSERQTWTSLRCAKCAAAAQPYRATCVSSALVRVDIRCPNCQNEWQLVRDATEVPSNPPQTISH